MSLLGRFRSPPPAPPSTPPSTPLPPTPRTTVDIDVHGQKFTIFGDPDDSYFANLSLGDGTNDFVQEAIANHLPPDGVAFDVGANIGVTTVLLAAGHGARRIISFEPSAEAVPFLKKAVAHNRLDNVEVLQAALGAAQGTMRFMDAPGSPSASHLVQDAVSLGENSSAVQVTTIDDVVRTRNILRLDFIKIDVEGFEPDVIEGAVETIARLRPVVFVEFNSFTLIAYKNMNPRDFLSSLMNRFAVYCRHDGETKRIVSDGDVLGFIHRNLVQHGCIDDLLCVPL